MCKPKVQKARAELEAWAYKEEHGTTAKIMNDIISEKKGKILTLLDVIEKAERLESEAREWSEKEQKYYGTVIAQAISIMGKHVSELEAKQEALDKQNVTYNIRFLKEGETEEDARRINMDLE